MKTTKLICLFFILSAVFFSCGKDEEDNYGLINNKFGVRNDTVPSVAYTNEAVYANYTINLGEFAYTASIEKIKGSYELYFNNKEVVTSLVVDYPEKTDAVFKIVPQSKLADTIQYVFSLYNEDKSQLYVDTVTIPTKGVSFSVKNNNVYPSVLGNCDSNNEGRWLFHGQSVSFTIESKHFDNFKVHIYNSISLFGSEVDRPKYYIGGKNMPSNGLFDLSIPPVPSNALQMGAGTYTINTNSGRYAYAPFSYKKGEGKANDFIQIYIMNSAGEYKIVKWEFSFSDPGGYNPG